MYWSFLAAVVCTFILSYPPTQYVMEGIHGPLTFSTRLGVFGFMVVAFVLGFFMSLGKAAVYKHIPVYYPDRVGAVGGMVGLVGGLGGFVLPIAFGALNDLTGRLAELLLAAVRRGLHRVWSGCTSPSGRWSARRRQQASRHGHCPNCRKCSRSMGRRRQGALAATGAIKDWRPEDAAFWESTGRAIARRNLWISVPCLLLSFAVWMVWSVVVAKLPSVGFAFSQRAAVLAGRTARPVRRDAACLLRVHAGDLRRPAVDDADNVVAADPRGRHGLRGAEPRHAVLDLPGPCTAMRPGRRQLRVVDGQYLVLLPEGREGQRAGHQRRSRQPRRQRRAVRRAAGDHRGRVRLARRCTADGDRRQASQTTLWLQNAGFVFVPFIVASAFAAWFGMNDIATMKASFADQSVIFRRMHNWIMCWLYTGTFGSFIGFSAAFPLLSKILFPAVNALCLCLPRAAGRRAGAGARWQAVRPVRRRTHHPVGVRRHERLAPSASSTPSA